MGAQGIALGDAPVARDPALFRRLVFLGGGRGAVGGEDMRAVGRSEEHTSELQSLMRISYAVFCLKKKKTKTRPEILKTKHTKKQQLTKLQLTRSQNTNNN